MGQITSSVGLISGINTGQIVDELMQIESQPVQVLQTQLDSVNEQQQAYSALATQLGTMQSIGQTLEQSDTFTQSTATSSDPSVLTATAANGAAVGTYTLQVAQTVTTQQLISTGFSSQDSAVGSGNITIEMGGGSLATATTLASLNGGTGVAGGEFRITDRDGNSAVIDTSTDVTLDDVMKQINTATGISVKASISGNHLVLTDTTGKTTGDLTVADMDNGTTAADLGIASTSSTGTITGSTINYLSSNTALSTLNDGRGVQSLSNGDDDFSVKLSNGSTVQVNLASAASVGDVINLINTAGGGNLTASINANGDGITLTDNTGTSGMTVTDENGSDAAAQLGLTTGTSSGGTLTGSNIVGGLDSTLLSTLNGGSGLSLGSIAFTDRAGDSETIDFSGATTIQDVLDDINNATGVKLNATLNSSGDGIQINDASGGSGSMTIADVSGTGAQQLGIAGTFSNGAAASGSDLHKQWLTQSTQLSSLNGGKGIDDGSFTITNSLGQSATVDVDTTAVKSVGDLLALINSKDIGVTASINSTGNGILLTDNAGGTESMTVNDVDGGTTADELNLTGTATNGQIDGAYEKTIQVTAQDTLSTLETKINALDWGVSATIINDGSASDPYRLSLTAQNSGTAGQVVVNTGTTNLNTYNLVNAQDAAVFVGSANSANPLLVTSSTNQVSNVISGVTMDLQGVSSSPVTLTIARDGSGISSQLNNFVGDFNELVEAINTLTSYDSTTNQAGLLLGDSTTLQIQSDIYDMLDTTVDTGNANIHSLADVGITVGDNAELQFDQDTFDQAFESDPDAVEKLFNATTTTTDSTGNTTTNKLGVAYSIDNTIDSLTDTENGLITIENQGLSSKMSAFQDQITSLNAQLSDKRNVLEEQFDNMETVLANLQTQQESLSSLTGASTTSSSSSSSKSSS